VLAGMVLAATMARAAHIEAQLSAAESSAPWRRASRTTLDIDCDGRSDDVYLAQTNEKVFIAVARADVRLPDVLRFDIGGHSHAAICARPPRIERVPLMTTAPQEADPAASAPTARASSCHSVRLSGGDCDPIYIFWDVGNRRVSWWRR
jgi:hypothetical protein